MAKILPYILDRFEQLDTTPQEAKYIFFWSARPKKPNIIDESCCCQWYHSRFKFEGVGFLTAEHAMMYSKAKMFGDEKIMSAILLAQDPKSAKQLGRQVRNFDAAQWDHESFEIVKRINIAKFTSNPMLKNWICSQPDNTVFVEASPYDAIWGIKRANDGKVNLKKIENWLGLNKLGFALTEARQSILSNQG